jgi:hypothetical protein
MTQDQFIDACILAGFDLCSTFPPLLEGPFNFRGLPLTDTAQFTAPCPCRRCLANTPRPSQPLTKWSRATKPDSLRCKTTSITPKYKSSTTSTCSCARGTPAFGCDCFGPASPLARPFQEYHSAPRHLYHQLYLRAVQQARLPKVSFFATTSSRFKLLIHERGVSPRSNWLQRPARVDQPAPAE